jgi:probable HAF family extracellular repeat protein
MVDLGGPFDASVPDRYAEGTGLSPDGTVVIAWGELDGFNDWRAIRSGSTGGVLLPALSGIDGIARPFDVSDSGAIVVGFSVTPLANSHATRWTGVVPTDLGTISDVVGNSVAGAISGNASVMVGSSFNGSGQRACIFRGPGVPVQDLGVLQPTDTDSYAADISTDGNIIVGASDNGTEQKAFVWTQAEGMKGLARVDDAAGIAFANAVSANGSTIVGASDNNSRPGGFAAIWLNRQPRQLYDLLKNVYGADLSAWTSFDTIHDCSDDGSVLVGTGTSSAGHEVAYRVVLTPNRAPTVAGLAPKTVEGAGAVTNVQMTATVSDADAADRLTVQWFVGGTLRQTFTDVVPGSASNFAFNYPDGPSVVRVVASDGKANGEASVTVTVADTESPIVIVAADVVAMVDPGELFATVALAKPSVTDVADPAPVVTNNAPAKFALGTTQVLWTVRDKSKNVATSTQRVTVVNAAPLANAGPDIVKKSSKPKLRVSVSGLRSSDSDGHTLTYAWSAPGVRFAAPAAGKTSGLFKVGKKTKVTLTVTDEAGVSSVDTVTVDVKKLVKKRPAATVADAAMKEGYKNAAASVAKGQGGPVAAAGMGYAASACFLGTLAGDDGSSAATTDYLALRLRQSELANVATERFREAYLLGGDQYALTATMYAYSAAAYSQADLANRETSDVVEAKFEVTP